MEEKKNSFRFFCNKDCEYFPCHELSNKENIFHIRTTKEQMDRGLDPALLHEHYFVDSDVEDAKRAELAKEAMEEVSASPVSPQNE